MPEALEIKKVVVDDHHWSETLKQEVYTYRCPSCLAMGFITRVNDVVQCGCGLFLRIVDK